MAIQIKITAAPSAEEAARCAAGATDRLVFLGNRPGTPSDTLEMFAVTVRSLTPDPNDASGQSWTFQGTLEGATPPREVRGYFGTATGSGWLEIAE